jgi:hypothetical protein
MGGIYMLGDLLGDLTHRNNVVFEWKTETNSLQVLHYSLAPYLSCATKAYLLKIGLGYLSTIGANG